MIIIRFAQALNNIQDSIKLLMTIKQWKIPCLCILLQNSFNSRHNMVQEFGSFGIIK
jgi:hypothetical protein